MNASKNKYRKLTLNEKNIKFTNEISFDSLKSVVYYKGFEIYVFAYFCAFMCIYSEKVYILT